CAERTRTLALFARESGMRGAMMSKGLRLTCSLSTPRLSRHGARAAAGLLGAGLLAATAAQATLINFDDLKNNPCTEEFCDPLPVDDQYAALGVRFYGAGLATAPGADYVRSAPNAIGDIYGPGLAIDFLGVLPSSVSFYVSAALKDALYVTAYGPGGVIGS